jgi:CHAT domain-containing protein/tetratricopeptide (TPR) repeat protein
MKRTAAIAVILGAVGWAVLWAGQGAAPDEASRLLAKVRADGAERYNQNDPKGCIEIFRRGLSDVHKLLETRPELQCVIDAGIARSEAVASPADRAFALLDVIQLLQKRLGPPAPIKGPTPAEKAEVDRLWKKVEGLKKAEKWPELPAAYRALIARQVEVFGAEAVHVAGALNQFGVFYVDLCESGKARPLLERCVEILRAHKHERLPDCLDRLARVYQELAEFDKARDRYEEAVRLRKAVDEKSPEVARSLLGLASLANKRGEVGEAKQQFQACLVVFEQAADKYRPDRLECLMLLAYLHVDVSDYAAAQGYLDQAHALHDKAAKEDQDPMFKARCDQLQAELYRFRGEKYEEAEALYKDLLKVYAAAPLPRATCLQALASLYFTLDRYDEAEPLYQQSLKARIEALGPDHPEVARVLNDLGLLYRTRKDYDKAERLLVKSLAIRRAKLGADHLLVGLALGTLADLSDRKGEADKAEKLYLEGLDILKKRLKDNRDVATALDNLGAFYQKTGRHAEAEARIEEGLKIRLAKLPAGHRDLALSYSNLALAQASQGKIEAALASADRDRRIIRRYVASILPLLTVRQQLAFLKAQKERDFALALSLGLAFPDRADAAAASAGWLLNGKAVAHQVLAESALLARDSKDPAVKGLVAKLTEAREELSRLTVLLSGPAATAEHRKRYEERTGQEQELAVELQLKGRDHGVAAPWVELKDLCAALPKDAVFVDIARLRPYAFKAGPGAGQAAAARYAAWVTDPAGKVELVDLGEADPADALVDQVRKALARTAHAIGAEDVKERKAEEELRAPLKDLSERILKPLLPHIGTSPRWVLCPDGDLWLVPWDALLLPDGSYAVEKHVISYVTSGRDLVAAAGRPKVAPQPPLILADPDFGVRGQGPKPPAGAPPGPFAGLFWKVAPLPWTGAEALAVAPQLKAYTKAEPRLLLGDKATKKVAIAARNPAVLLLSTHGFFLAEKGKGGAFDNPLLRCGLLFAGCNDPDRPEQGVLTGLEVIGTDLRGTELVVLSACDTAVGEVRQGEGVAGLRQCFQLAGAEAVMATLWKVPDEATAKQVAHLFELLAKGCSKAQALAQAQRKQIEDRRAVFQAAHPFFWGAFTLTGRAD